MNKVSKLVRVTEPLGKWDGESKFISYRLWETSKERSFIETWGEREAGREGGREGGKREAGREGGMEKGKGRRQGE